MIAPFPHATHAGKSPMVIAEYFCSQIGKVDATEQLYKLKGESLHSSTTPPDLLPGVREIQQYLAQTDIKYGIASNATKQFLANSIAQLSLGFDTFFGFEDYTYPKPHPEAYLSLARYLGVNEDSYSTTWVFEDSLTGTAAARDAGMFAVGILTQYTEQELRAAGSQLVFPSLLEAYQYLKDIKS